MCVPVTKLIDLVSIDSDLGAIRLTFLGEDFTHDFVIGNLVTAVSRDVGVMNNMEGIRAGDALVTMFPSVCFPTPWQRRPVSLEKEVFHISLKRGYFRS